MRGVEGQGEKQSMNQGPETSARWHDSGGQEDSRTASEAKGRKLRISRPSERRAAGAEFSRVWGRSPEPPEVTLDTRLPWAGPGCSKRGTAPWGTHSLIRDELTAVRKQAPERQSAKQGN